MKKTILILGALLSTAACAFSAESLKVGIVSMQEILQNFYETKQAQIDLNLKRDEVKEDLDRRRAKLRDLARELEDITKLIQDDTTKVEFKRIKMEERENKLNEAKALERDVMQLARQKERQLQLELERVFRGIRERATLAVDEIARRDGYDLVFDSSGLGIGGSPLLLFSKDAVNFTASVLGELNKDQPEELKNLPPVGVPQPEAGESKE